MGSTHTRVHINPASLLFVIALISGVGYGIYAVRAYFIEQKELREAALRKEEQDRLEQQRLEQLRYEQTQAAARAREEAERAARLETERLRAETERKRIEADAEARRMRAEKEALEKLAYEKQQAEEAERNRLAELERAKIAADQERIRLQLDATAREQAIEEARAGIKVTRRALADGEAKVLELEKTVKGFGPRLAHCKQTMEHHQAAFNDWNQKQGVSENPGGVVVIQDNRSQMEIEAKKFMAAQEEAKRLAPLKAQAERDLREAQRGVEQAQADLNRFTATLKNLGIDLANEPKPEPPKAAPSALKTYVLKDGRQLRVAKAVDFGNDWSLKLESGEMLAVPKGEVVEVKP